LFHALILTGTAYFVNYIITLSCAVLRCQKSYTPGTGLIPAAC